MAWQDAVEDAADGVRLLLDVTPGAKEARFPAGFEPWRGRIVVRVTAPPTEGRANEEVRELVAAFFAVPPRDVTVVAGLRDRRKSVQVAVDRAAAEALLGGRLVSEVDRLARLEAALARLREAAVGQVVLVEGPKDRVALDALGVGGEHIQLNRGHSVEAFMDRVVEEAAGRRVVLLMDWDRTGGRLAQRLEEGLRARVPLDADPRRLLALACHVKSVEEVPAELAALRRAVGPEGASEAMRKP